MTEAEIGTGTGEVEGLTLFSRAWTFSWMAASSARKFVFFVLRLLTRELSETRVFCTSPNYLLREVLMSLHCFKVFALPVRKSVMAVNSSSGENVILPIETIAELERLKILELAESEDSET